MLNIQIPSPDGLKVLRCVRAGSQTPVIMLTSRAEDIERLLGLELGADDCVVKPFNPREVVERVRAVLRRAQPQETRHLYRLIHAASATLLELDTQAVLCEVSEQRLELTPTELRLLEAMLKAVGRAFSRQELLEVALPDSETLERVVDAHLKDLRRKLDDNGVGEMLETVRGIGYRLWGGA